MANTYEFGSFSDNEEELKRLNIQALVSIKMERQVLKDAGIEDGMDILDVGCGTGLTAIELSSFSPSGKVLGVDVNKALLSVAERHIRDKGVENVSFDFQDVLSLNLGCQKFDFAVSRFLYQHLADPILAMKNVYKYLSANGRYLVCDVDDQFLTIYPPNDDFDAIVAAAKTGQGRAGGDRLVGRKLASYMLKAGFSKVDYKLIGISSTDIGLSTFLNITTSFKKEIINENEMHADEVAERLERLSTLDSSHIGMVAVCIVLGHR